MNGSSSLRGSWPEITPTDGGRAHAGLGHADSPSAISAIARCTALATRSARLVVATEQLAGCRGMPDHAVLAQMDVDAPEAAGVRRHGVAVDAVEDADHRRGAGAVASREVQAARLGSRGCRAGRPSTRPSGRRRPSALTGMPSRHAGERIVMRGRRSRCRAGMRRDRRRPSAARCSRTTRPRSASSASQPISAPSAQQLALADRAPRRAAPGSRPTTAPARGCAPGTCG